MLTGTATLLETVFPKAVIKRSSILDGIDLIFSADGDRFQASAISEADRKRVNVPVATIHMINHEKWSGTRAFNDPTQKCTVVQIPKFSLILSQWGELDNIPKSGIFLWNEDKCWALNHCGKMRKNLGCWTTVEWRQHRVAPGVNKHLHAVDRSNHKF